MSKKEMVVENVTMHDFQELCSQASNYAAELEGYPFGFFRDAVLIILMNKDFIKGGIAQKINEAGGDLSKEIKVLEPLSDEYKDQLFAQVPDNKVLPDFMREVLLDWRGVMAKFDLDIR